jgi:hypothetical protein
LSLSSFNNYVFRKAIFASILLLSSSAIAQNLVIDKTSDLITKHGVSISSKLQNCENAKNGTSKEYILLTVFNENPYPVQLSFKRNLWFDGKCNSCNSESTEHTVSVTIEANKKVEGSCDESSGLRIFSRMLNLEKVAKLTNYELVNIEVDEVK